MLNSITTQPKCPSCGKPKMVTDENSGELFCAGCGFVINEKLKKPKIYLNKSEFEILFIQMI